MLSQGLVSSLAVNQLQQASTIQLEPFAIASESARSLAVKVLVSSLQGSST